MMSKPYPCGLLSEREDAAMWTACRFLGLDVGDWRRRRYGFKVTFGPKDLLDPGEMPHVTMRRTGYAGGSVYIHPLCTLYLRPDWHDAVWMSGFCHLPPPIIGKPAMILHVGQEHTSGDTCVARAIWTFGGEKVQIGFIAYKRDYWSARITCWEVSTTSQRAVKKLERAIRIAVEEEEIPVSLEDADAFEEAF